MKIERNGVEYELTSTELHQAFCEQQHLNDISDLDLVLWEHLSDDELEKLRNNTEFTSETAYLLRSYIDELGMDFDIAASKAIEDIKNNFLSKEDD